MCFFPLFAKLPLFFISNANNCSNLGNNVIDSISHSGMIIPNRSLEFMADQYLFRADWAHHWRTLRKARAEEACLLCRAIATSTKLRCEEIILWMVSIAKRRTKLRRDRDVDKMPKEMLIWHKQTLNPNRSLGFMPDQYLFRADWPYRCRRRSGLRRDRDVAKMPKEMQIWHKKT